MFTTSLYRAHLFFEHQNKMNEQDGFFLSPFCLPKKGTQTHNFKHGTDIHLFLFTISKKYTIQLLLKWAGPVILEKKSYFNFVKCRNSQIKKSLKLEFNQQLFQKCCSLWSSSQHFRIRISKMQIFPGCIKP